MESLRVHRTGWAEQIEKIKFLETGARALRSENEALERLLDDADKSTAELTRLIPNRGKEAMEQELKNSLAEYFYTLLRESTNDFQNKTEIDKSCSRLRKAFFAL